MEALKKNKFLSTFFGVVAALTLVLGWLLFSSWRDQTAKAEAFQAEKDEVDRLESKPLFPNEANLKARRAQVDAFAASVNELQEKLIERQPELNKGLRSDQFQSKLTETLREIKGLAEMTKLADKGGEFDLGMGKYLSTLPSEAAVPDLDFQLEALASLVRVMLADRVASIDNIVRSELPIESGKVDDEDAKSKASSSRGSSRSSSTAAAAPKVLDEKEVLQRYPFELRFSGTGKSVQAVLNHIANDPQHFFAIRAIRVENEKKDGPDKSLRGYSSTDGQKKDSTIVLGGEKVFVWLAVDLIRFHKPGAASAPAKTTAATK